MCYSEPEPAPLCRPAASSLSGPAASADEPVFHAAAGFEGVEKRLELEFSLPAGAGDDASSGAPLAHVRRPPSVSGFSLAGF